MGSFAPRGHLAIPGNIFVCHTVVRGPLLVSHNAQKSPLQDRIIYERKYLSDQG